MRLLTVLLNRTLPAHAARCFCLTTNQRTTHFSSLAFERSERTRALSCSGPVVQTRRFPPDSGRRSSPGLGPCRAVVRRAAARAAFEPCSGPVHDKRLGPCRAVGRKCESAGRRVESGRSSIGAWRGCVVSRRQGDRAERGFWDEASSRGTGRVVDLGRRHGVGALGFWVARRCSTLAIQRYQATAAAALLEATVTKAAASPVHSVACATTRRDEAGRH